MGEQRFGRLAVVLDRADPGTPLVATARELLEEISALPTAEPNRLQRLLTAIRLRYLALVERPRFSRVIATVVGVWAIVTLVGSFTLVLSLIVGNANDAGDLDFIHWATMASSSLSALYVVGGIRQLIWGDRVVAFRRFERAFLIAIFVTSVFAFYESQFTAAFGLGINILMLVTFNKMAGIESLADPRSEPVPEPA